MKRPEKSELQWDEETLIYVDFLEQELQAERESKWISADDRLPEVETEGAKVLLYRVLNEGQSNMSKSIHDTVMVKHCNPKETWWQPLPDKPENNGR